MSNEVEALVRLITDNQKNGMAVAEVGVFNGDTSVAYLPIIKANGGTSLLIDWFRGNVDNAEGIHRYNEANVTALQQSLQQRVNDIGCQDIVTILAGDSLETAETLVDESLDICFIDADHRYDFVVKDILAYLPKVKKGGILCGHDCENYHLMDALTEDYRHIDYVPTLHCHPGVLFALKDLFISQNKDIEYYEDYGVHRIPIWVYRVPQ